MYYLFSFKTRFETMKFYSLARNKNVSCAVVSTPTSIFSGCSLSVRCEESDFMSLLNLYCNYSFSTFTGAYKIEGQNAVKVY